MDRVRATGKDRKRKAENQDNERLSKRLSLLNLERNGQKLYVPVEQPSKGSTSPNPFAPRQPHQPEVMQLDDSKHRVYIYDLDAELSDSSESDDGKLVFLPDIEKHLRESRIPPSVLANEEGELAGNKQMVLYNVPRSLTIPEEQDSVRKAIIETRARARAKRQQELQGDGVSQTMTAAQNGVDTHDWYGGMISGTLPRSRSDREIEDMGLHSQVDQLPQELDAMELD
ncbi:hypothetical protein BJ875DRAFT_62054 [Amylocarpus encephaloides]|uniref:Uncharacterized protein n=1 Tax=Amylocarpus encephaloides TaxID=45428 RepID=A0A9P8C4A6_9HELO|nr:hypothetical protein BJ875DRAFT_62054 [Amylocarpus encephaloides]